MSFKNNFFLFFTSVVMTLIFVFFAAMITSYQSDFAENIFSVNEDGSFEIMEKSYKANEKAVQTFEKYLSVCEKINSKIFPDIITSPLKKTAASIFDAAYGMFRSFFNILFELTLGNM